MYLCLQSITPVPQIACSLWCDTCETTSHDGSQNVIVNVEEGLESEGAEGPYPISFPKIKAEIEVSSVSVFSLLHISQLFCAHVSVAFLHPSVHDNNSHQ